MYWGGGGKDYTLALDLEDKSQRAPSMFKIAGIFRIVVSVSIQEVLEISP